MPPEPIDRDSLLSIKDSIERLFTNLSPAVCVFAHFAVIRAAVSSLGQF